MTKPPHKEGKAAAVSSLGLVLGLEDVHVHWGVARGSRPEVLKRTSNTESNRQTGAIEARVGRLEGKPENKVEIVD